MGQNHPADDANCDENRAAQPKVTINPIHASLLFCARKPCLLNAKLRPVHHLGLGETTLEYLTRFCDNKLCSRYFLGRTNYPTERGKSLWTARLGCMIRDNQNSTYPSFVASAVPPAVAYDIFIADLMLSPVPERDDISFQIAKSRSAGVLPKDFAYVRNIFSISRYLLPVGAPFGML